ncbi:MAG: ABC transporter substrate-binding protein [Deltaproteobacteria bacterium]|nr:ABC transporter substrate-binding protein [Deltaproteobacteria bacterium]
MIKLVLLAVFSSLLVEARPIETIESGLKRVLDINSEYKSQNKLLSSEHVSALYRIAEDYIDFSEMARRSFGTVWNSMNDREKDEGVKLLKEVLIKTYVDRVAKAQPGQVTVVSESVTGDKGEVVSHVQNEKNKATIEYRLRKVGGSWKVFDVVIEGVSLVVNYRQEFNSIFKASGTQGVLDSLRRKIEKLSA